MEAIEEEEEQDDKLLFRNLTNILVQIKKFEKFVEETPHVTV